MTEQTNNLIVAEPLDVSKVFTFEGMDGLLQDIETQVKAQVPDAETEQGRKDIISLAYQVSRSKSFIVNTGEASIAKHAKKVKSMKGLLKTAKTFLDNLRDETRQPVSDWEDEQAEIQAEEEEKERKLIQDRIDALQKVDCVMSYLVIGPMTDDEFANLYQEKEMKWTEEQVRIAEEKRVENERKKQEEIRLAEERVKQAEENERLEKVRKEQEAEAARLKKIRQEQEYKQQKAQEEFEAEQKAKAEELAKQQAEIAAQQKTIQDEKDRIIREENENRRNIREQSLKTIGIFRAGIAGESLVCKFEDFIYNGQSFSWNVISEMDDSDFNTFSKELKVQIDSFEASAKKFEKEREAKEAEELKIKEAHEKARLEALKPDREKLSLFAEFLQNDIQYPEVTSKEAKAVLKKATIEIYDIGNELFVWCDEL